MPYLHLDLPGTYPLSVKRELATRLCKLYADVMETQLWRPNVGIAELGEQSLSPRFRRPRAHHHGHGRVSSWSPGGKAAGVRSSDRRHLRRAARCASPDGNGRVHTASG